MTEIISSYGNLLIKENFNMNLTYRLLSFFFISIPFYIGGIMSLKNSYNLSQKINKNKRGSYILSSIVFRTTFIVSVFLYLMAIAFENIQLFVTCILIILSMSYIWLSFKKSLFRRFGRNFKFPYEELLKINVITFLFLLFYFYLGKRESDFLLFISLLIRMIWDLYNLSND